QQLAAVLHGAHASAHGEGYEDLVGRAPDHLHHGVALIGGRGDIEEHDLVGALGVVQSGQLGRVSCVAQVLEVDALPDASCVHVEAGDHPDGAHAATASSTLSRPS